MSTVSNVTGDSTSGASLGAPGGSGGITIPSKPDGEPYFLIYTGQSNGISAAIGSITRTPNPNVKVWQSDGLAGGQARAFTWQSVDLAAAVQTDYTPAAMYSGVVLGDVGHMGWACADLIQRRTGRVVYLVCVAHAAQAIAQWLVAGTMEVELDARVTAALATTEVVNLGVTKADAVFWMQGESDAKRSSTDYIIDWEAVRAWMEAAGHIERFHTQWAIGETGHGGSFSFAGSWRLLAALDASQDEYVRLVRSTSMSFQSGLNLHFDGDGHMRMGWSAAESILAGPIPKTQTDNESFQITVTGNYTTTGLYAHEIVLCNNTIPITITLHPIGVDDNVTIARTTQIGVDVVGDGSELIMNETKQKMPRGTADLIGTDLPLGWLLT